MHITIEQLGIEQPGQVDHLSDFDGFNDRNPYEPIDLLSLPAFQIAEADLPDISNSSADQAEPRYDQESESGRLARARQWLGSLATTGRHAKAGRLKRGYQAVSAAIQTTKDTANIRIGAAYAGFSERMQSTPERRGRYNNRRLYMVGGLALAAVVSRTHAIDMFGGAEHTYTGVHTGDSAHLQLAAFETDVTVDDAPTAGDDTTTSTWDRFTSWVKEGLGQTGPRTPFAGRPDVGDPISTRVPIETQPSPALAFPDLSSFLPSDAPKVIPPVAAPHPVDVAPVPLPAPSAPIHLPDHDLTPVLAIPDAQPVTVDPLDTPPKPDQYLWNYMHENHVAPDARIMDELDQAARDMHDDTGASFRWHGSGQRRWLSVNGESGTTRLWQILRPYLHK